MNIADFRAMFPAFVDAAKYPDPMLNLWWNAAGLHLTKSWALGGDTYDLARNLLTAHLVQTANTAADGESVSGGAVQSVSTGSVSVSLTAPPTKDGWQYWLSGTPYGVQLWAMLSLAGAGGLYVGGLPERESFRKSGGVWS